jgi:hypothetical protein
MYEFMALGSMENKTEANIKEHIICFFSNDYDKSWCSNINTNMPCITEAEIEDELYNLNILIAYETYIVNNGGRNCAFCLFRHKVTREYYYLKCDIDSAHGFEGYFILNKLEKLSEMLPIDVSESSQAKATEVKEKIRDYIREYVPMRD